MDMQDFYQCLVATLYCENLDVEYSYIINSVAFDYKRFVYKHTVQLSRLIFVL